MKRDWYREILSAYKQEDHERLSTLLIEAKDRANRDAGYLTALGEILFEQGNLQEAMESYTLALHYDAKLGVDGF